MKIGRIQIRRMTDEITLDEATDRVYKAIKEEYYRRTHEDIEDGINDYRVRVGVDYTTGELVVYISRVVSTSDDEEVKVTRERRFKRSDLGVSLRDFLCFAVSYNAYGVGQIL